LIWWHSAIEESSLDAATESAAYELGCVTPQIAQANIREGTSFKSCSAYDVNPQPRTVERTLSVQ